jgi:hypothetical protein
MPEYRNLDSDRISMPAEGTPEFIMTGVTKPDGTKRLYASRNLDSPAWGQRETVEGTVRWHLRASLDQLLVIDRPTWGEAFTAAWTIWANQDRAHRQAIAANESRHQPGHGSLERVADGSMVPRDYVPYDRLRELEGGDRDAASAEG